MAAVRVKIAGEQKSLYILLKVQKMAWGKDCERLFWEPQVPGVLRKWGGRKDVGAQDSLELCFLSLSPLTPATHTFTHSPMVYSPSSGYIKCQNTVSVILELSEIKFLLGILVCCLALKLSSLFLEIPVRRRARREKKINIQRFWTRWLKEGGTQRPPCSAVELSSLRSPSSSPLPGSSDARLHPAGCSGSLAVRTGLSPSSRQDSELDLSVPSWDLCNTQDTEWVHLSYFLAKKKNFSFLSAGKDYEKSPSSLQLRRVIWKWKS